MRRLSVMLLAGVCCFPVVARAQETLAGVGAASGMAAGMGAMAASSIRPGEVTRNVGQPRMPRIDGPEGDVPGMPGMGGMMGGNAAPPPVAEPTRFTVDSGDKALSELLAGRPVTSRGSMTTRELARLTSAQRAANRRKYRAVRNWTAYYLPQDRYKVTSNVWRFVSIEDDAGDYPVQHYYRPNSPVMLDLLRHRPKNGQARANRVIGFRTWQDAMKAGYRPDPISKPEPAGSIIYMAKLARTPQLARYVEYVYGGQVTPESFNHSVRYTREVERIVRSRKDTRPLLKDTMRQVFAAFVGEGSLPTSVGRSYEPPQNDRGMFGRPGGFGAPGPGGPTPPGLMAGNTDSRVDDFNRFGSRAGNLANVPANNAPPGPPGMR